MKIQGFQAVSTDTRTVVGLGPRYGKPLDRTTVLRVFHRTIGGGASFLLEREQFTQLRVWLDGDRSEDLRFETPTHSADFRVAGIGRLFISTGWKSASGGKGRVELGPEDSAALAVWVADKDDHGWDGWKEPPPGAVCRCSRECAAGRDCDGYGYRHQHVPAHMSPGCPLHLDAFSLRDPVR